jgi:uroporphyrinogen-III synthase
MRRVLVLRPEPGASATLRRARELGLDAISVPLFEVGPVAWTAPDPTQFDGLLLTSANAIRHGGRQLERLRSLEVYAVGEATADAARQAGFHVVFTGHSDVRGLLTSIEPDLKLLHLCGADRRDPDGPRQEITRVVVYRSREIESPALARADGSIALIHSPRAGRRLAELTSERSGITIAAISIAAGEAVGNGWQEMAIATQPSDEALLALAARLCNNPQPK